MNIDTDSLTRAQVAELIGMSDSWVRDRMQAGDLPRPGVSANEYVAALVEYRVAQALEKSGGSGMGGEGLEYERTRLTAEQADAKAMANAVTRRELLPISAFVRALTAGVVDVRARFLSQPSALAQELLDITDRQEMSDRLTADVTERLEALSEANFDGIMEAAFGSVEDGAVGSETASEADAE
ncbi:MAG: hypothetical protein ACRYG4_17185 [Janthinobacterium lividum]